MTTPTFSKCLSAVVNTEDVLLALGRYTRESNESDRRTAAMLGIKRATLMAWLQGADPPQKRLLARVAGFLSVSAICNADPILVAGPRPILNETTFTIIC